MFRPLEKYDLQGRQRGQHTKMCNQGRLQDVIGVCEVYIWVKAGLLKHDVRIHHQRSSRLLSLGCGWQ